MARINNAAPMFLTDGVNDLSVPPQLVVPDEIPQHLPLTYVYAEQGPLTPQLVVGNNLNLVYGANTWDLRKSYANHATVFAQEFNAQGNAQFIQRLKPTDAGPHASLRLYADFLPKDIIEYERNSDGTFALNSEMAKIPTGQVIPGFEVMFTVDEVEQNLEDGDTFGIGMRLPGSRVNASTESQSERWPLLDLRVPYFGKKGNNTGLRMWAPTLNDKDPLNRTLLDDEKAYTFRMALVRRADENSTVRIAPGIRNEQSIDFTFKTGVINKKIDAEQSLMDIFIKSYSNTNVVGQPVIPAPFSEIKVYQENLEELLQMFYLAEVASNPTFTDFLDEAGEYHRFNFIGGETSDGAPYQSYVVITNETEAVRLTETTNLMARGGSDGTMNNALFAQLVEEAVAEWADPNSPLMDTAKYPVKIMYDSGFPLQTKQALVNFIAERKSNVIVLSTFSVDGPAMTASEEASVALALRTRLQMFPESSFFGTPVMRGVIMGRNGHLINSQYKGRLPLTLELASKAARYMGQGNGRWRNGGSFDVAPNSLVTMFKDVNVTFTPASTRNNDWELGLNWVQSYDTNSLFFPAVQTAYPLDESVLNSFDAMMACAELELVGERVWRDFSGSRSLTTAQLLKRVEDRFNEYTLDRFDNKFIIEPVASKTAADVARGYSYSLTARIAAPNQSTVMSFAIESYRIDDFVSAAA